LGIRLRRARPVYGFRGWRAKDATGFCEVADGSDSAALPSACAKSYEFRLMSRGLGSSRAGGVLRARGALRWLGGGLI